MANNIIEVRNLSIDFPLRNGTLHAVQNVDFDVPEGKITALVGESGSGKSTIAMGIMNVVSTPGKITSGNVYFKGKDVLKYSKENFKAYRWKKVSMVFQAAQNSLNPVMTVKEHILETAFAHEPAMKETEIIARATELLDFVRLEPKRVLNAYPHELSGGMKQRVMIAFSLLLNPEMIILDEPTTALDVITQDYIFDILEKTHKKFKNTMLLLTHDIGVVAKVAERIGVMYAGQLMEIGDVFTIFDKPAHPYTSNLIKSAPSLVDDLGEKAPIVGQPPNLFEIPVGCPYVSKCTKALLVCSKEKPGFTRLDEDHIVACHLYKSQQAEVRNND